MALIRKIVLAIEENPSGWAPDPLEIEGYTSEQIRYHNYLLMQAGLAEGREIQVFDITSPAAILTNLTWAGHEFADAARDDTRWKKAMEVVHQKGGAITLSVLTELLKALMRNTFGLP